MALRKAANLYREPPQRLLRGAMWLALVAALGIALMLAAYVILDRDGQFSPRKCIEQGGKWDEAVELCHKP